MIHEHARVSSRIVCVCFEGAQEQRTGEVLFCLWNEFTVSVMCLSIFYFPAYKTEPELKLLENRAQILGK